MISSWREDGLKGPLVHLKWLKRMRKKLKVSQTDWQSIPGKKMRTRKKWSKHKTELRGFLRRQTDRTWMIDREIPKTTQHKSWQTLPISIVPSKVFLLQRELSRFDRKRSLIWSDGHLWRRERQPGHSFDPHVWTHLPHRHVHLLHLQMDSQFPSGKGFEMQDIKHTRVPSHRPLHTPGHGAQGIHAVGTWLNHCYLSTFSFIHFRGRERIKLEDN